MKNYQFIKISKTKKLRFISNYSKKNLYIIFLHGFASDIEGKKPKTFKQFSLKKKWVFLLWNIQDMANPQVNLQAEISPRGLMMQKK